MSEINQTPKCHPLHIGMRTIKTAVAAMVCAFLYFLLDRNPTFACIGAIFGMGSNKVESIRSGGNRLFGTIIGGFIGMWLFGIYAHFHPESSANFHYQPIMLLLVAIGIILLVILSQLVNWPGAIQPGGVMLCIILFNTPVDSYITYSFSRIFDTAVGVVISFLVNVSLPEARWKTIKAKLRKTLKK